MCIRDRFLSPFFPDFLALAAAAFTARCAAAWALRSLVSAPSAFFAAAADRLVAGDAATEAALRLAVLLRLATAFRAGLRLAAVFLRAGERFAADLRTVLRAAFLLAGDA